MNGAVVEEASQIVGEIVGAGVTFGGVFLQAFQTNRLQVARQFWLQPAGRHRLLRAHQLQSLQHRGAAKRRPARQHLVEDGAQGIHVGRRADSLDLTRRLLGRHVARRAHDLAALRLPRFGVELLGQAEVGDLRSQEPGVRSQ